MPGYMRVPPVGIRHRWGATLWPDCVLLARLDIVQIHNVDVVSHKVLQRDRWVQRQARTRRRQENSGRSSRSVEACAESEIVKSVWELIPVYTQIIPQAKLLTHSTVHRRKPSSMEHLSSSSMEDNSMAMATLPSLSSADNLPAPLEHLR
jgi:hypothetical protein